MLELASCITRSELPVDAGPGLVAFAFKSLDFPFEGGFVRDAPVQVLPAENAEFHFSASSRSVYGYRPDSRRTFNFKVV